MKKETKMSNVKTVHEYFSLQDDEYTITIVSYVNLWGEKYNDLLRMALEKYELREIEFVKQEALNRCPPQFPTLSFGTLYYIEAKIGTMPRGMYEQLKLEISQTTRVKTSAIFVSEDGDIPTITTTSADKAMLEQPHGEHENDKLRMPNFDVQELVGQKSVHSLLKAMEEEEAAKKEEMKDTYESKKYRTTHTVLKEHFGKPFPKGLYEIRFANNEVIVEGINNDSKYRPVPTIEQLNEKLAGSVSSFDDKYRKRT
jgi:hypothetical protein